MTDTDVESKVIQLFKEEAKSESSSSENPTRGSAVSNQDSLVIFGDNNNVKLSFDFKVDSASREDERELDAIQKYTESLLQLLKRKRK